MPNVKAFDINQWIQIVIGTLLLTAIYGLFKMVGDVQTLNIERQQDAQVILEMKSKINLMVDKISELNQEVALTKQAIKMLARTKGMEDIINHATCEGKDCLLPVPAPPPQLAPKPSPAKQ